MKFDFIYKWEFWFFMLCGSIAVTGVVLVLLLLVGGVLWLFGSL